MRIYRVKDYEEMSRKAAGIISAQVILKPDCVLGLATGSTPIGVYQRLVEEYRCGGLDFSEVRTANLDEYRGLSGDHPQSYRFFMFDKLFGHINVEPENVNIPDGMAEDAGEECRRYDAVISSLGGVDMQLLGIGRNGHIGFNEPCSVFGKGTHCVDLSESTREANRRFFASLDEVPRQALTMGIGTIMRAQKILLLASGEDKAKALKLALYGDVTPEVPASILQLHGDVTVVADEAALGA